MSKHLVKSVLKEYIEAGVPDEKDPWPIIRAMLPSADAERSAATTGGTNDNMAASPQAHSLPGQRKFRINPAMALVALVALVGLAALFVAKNRPIGDPGPLATQLSGGEFLPAGMVRHMILTGSNTIDQTALGGPITTTIQHHEEFWLTQGENRPLMKNIVTVPISATGWLDFNAYYEYEPAKSNRISWSKYDPQLLASLVPDPEIITKSLQLPNAHLVGNDTLDGRPVVVITVGAGATPSPTTKGLTPYGSTVTTRWIDRQTNQLLQASMETTTVGGTHDGLKETLVNKIALDELLPRSAFPADFFSFRLPEGAILFDLNTPTPAPNTPSKP